MNRGIFYIIFTALVFSTLEIVGKMLSTSINPFQLTFLRFLIGGLILLPFALREVKARKLILKLNDFMFFTFIGLINIVISMPFLQLAILNTKASIAAVIFCTNTVFTIPLAYLVLKEKLGKRMLISLLVSILGILFIFNPFSLTPDIKGILLAIAAAISFSLYSVVSKTRIKRYGGLILNSFSFIIGDALLLICLLFAKVPITSGVDSTNMWHILYLGIFVTGLGYLSYFAAMKHTSAITTSMVFFIKPALAPLLSLIILGESIKWNAVAGIVCIVSGALIVFVQGKQKQEPAQPSGVSEVSN